MFFSPRGFGYRWGKKVCLMTQGGDLLWGLAVFPFLAVCTLINLMLSRSILIHLFLYRDYRLFSLWLFIVVIWFGTVKYDLGRHFGDDPLPRQESSNP